jgi:hypothetical protein
VASIPAPSRSRLGRFSPEPAAEPRWLLLMRAADPEIIAARRCWRETYQRPTPQSIQSRAMEEAIKAKHAGGRT